MSAKKPANQKSRNSGISLAPDLIKRGKEFAEKNGMGSLSNLVRFLLTQKLSKADGEKSYILAEAPGNETPQGSASNVVVTPETSAGGRSTRQMTRYRKGGLRKSTT